MRTLIIFSQRSLRALRLEHCLVAAILLHVGDMGSFVVFSDNGSSEGGTNTSTDGYNTGVFVNSAGYCMYCSEEFYLIFNNFSLILNNS